MALPKSRVTTTGSLRSKTGAHCKFCGEADEPLRRNMNHEWVCANCDPSLGELIRVVDEKKS